MGRALLNQSMGTNVHIAIKMAVIVVVAGVGVFVASSWGRSNKHRDDLASRQAVFQQVWHTIGTKFYDRDMNGFDWLAVRTVYERKVRATKNSFDLYWHVLRPMTAVLESSHVGVTPPSSNRKDVSEPSASLNSRESELDSCAGLVIHDGRRPVSSRILRVNRDSPLYAFGVRLGWRFYGFSSEESDSRRIVLAFRSTSGEFEDVILNAGEGNEDIDMALVREDLAMFGRAKLQAKDPSEALTLGSLGISISVGQLGTMASVIDVENGSIAERSGIEPGSKFQEFQLKPLDSGKRHFEGKLVSPMGQSYAAKFDFQCAAGNLNSVRVSRQLPNDVLYLRFDVFDDGAAQWIGDELHRANPRAVILDLRRNVGGKVSELREVMGRFLPPGTTLVVMSGPESTEDCKTSASPIGFRGPMAVLIGPRSASAAEISASALKHYKRAELYGLDTFGNVLRAIAFPLEDGGSVVVATHDVRGPDGKRIENIGVKVDHEVKQTLATVRSGRDVVIDRAFADLSRASSN
jgi:C-terminal processing protease CtpA/Prc